ncbi:MAG TPA: homoserine kinase [Burkholderiales bacterium]|nr:homoserine kinase [Burkholderiales bacterium]
MSVFTPVAPEQMAAWLKRYSLGTLTQLEGIAAGIENTNYFVTTTHGRYVLTLFEKLTPRELPFYLNLMAHLARHGIPCPQPIADLDNEYLGALNDRPAAIVTCMPGSDSARVSAAQCAALGALLAEMHLAGASYRAQMTNPRGAAWRAAVLPQLRPFLGADEAALLDAEMQFQSQQSYDHLPRGVIHADLFRDNVLWSEGRVGGVIDFYFACTDALLYDVAITVNDWCLEESGEPALDPARVAALLAAYHELRPFTAAERDAWPALLRAGALRFWLSRLHDLHLPRAGVLTYAKDPRHFERLLRRHIARADDLRAGFTPCP